MLVSATVSVGLLALALTAPGNSAAGSVRTGRGERCGAGRASCGENVAPLVAKRALPGGGTAYIYDVDGTKVRSPVPPAGFDPARASAAKLAEYDFPSRPAGGRALRTWLAAVRNTHRAPPPAHMVFWQPAAGRAARRGVTAGPAVTVNSNNIWAGNMATSETYTNVYGYWIEPSTAEADCPADYQMEATWAGLGGWNTGTLVQAGTQYGMNQIYGPGISNHQAWYELVDNYTVEAFVPLPVTATVGAEMYVNIYRASAKGYNIYVVNESTGQAWGINFVTFSPYDGSTAEFIAEDPYGGVTGRSPVYLIRFGTFEVEDAEASVNDSTFEGLASWPHDDDVMISPTTGNRMAYAGSAFNGGDSWYDYHQNCQ
jgi:hypothetical protein